MIRENFAVGNKIRDGKGIEWTVANAWQHKDWWCMNLISFERPDWSGGLRVKLNEEEGGMLVAQAR